MTGTVGLVDQVMGVVLVGLVAGSLLLAPTRVGAATHDRKVARPVVPTAATASPPRLSPYANLARQHARTASGAAHAPVVPPTVKRTRQPIGQQSRP
jgi:hypothetical protein